MTEGSKSISQTPFHTVAGTEMFLQQQQNIIEKANYPCKYTFYERKVFNQENLFCYSCLRKCKASGNEDADNIIREIIVPCCYVTIFGLLPKHYIITVRVFIHAQFFGVSPSLLEGLLANQKNLGTNGHFMDFGSVLAFPANSG